MSFVIAVPEIVSDAATNLASLGSTVSAAHAAAAAPTTGMAAAAADEVSAAVATVFSEHGQAYQALSSHVAAFHAQFVQNMISAEAAYASAEAANASPLQSLAANGINIWYGNTGTGIGGILGNAGIGDIGFGNTGNHDIGFGNVGNGDIGIDNTGTGDFGLFNTSTGDIGIGLTGNNQFGLSTGDVPYILMPSATPGVARCSVQF